MFNFFKRKKYQDVTKYVSAISLFLINDTGSDLPTPFKEKLIPSKLNYTLESLKHVDLYLDEIRKNRKKLNEEQLVKVVARCGAYCGEVIRKHSKKNHYWINYGTAVSINKTISSFEKNLYTFYILFAEPDDFSFPFSKVGKYLEYGQEDSLYFFATMILQKNKTDHRGRL
jgi:hypothetical protein